MTTENPLTRVRDYVKQFDSALEPVLFPEETKTALDAARVLGVEVGQIAKSVLFRSDDQYGLFVAAGDVKVQTRVVKEVLGGKKPKLATPDEVVAITGFRVGAVCPFALAHDIPIFIDASLERFAIIYTAAGLPESVLPITFPALVAITRGTVISVADQPVLTEQESS